MWSEKVQPPVQLEGFQLPQGWHVLVQGIHVDVSLIHLHSIGGEYDCDGDTEGGDDNLALDTRWNHSIAAASAEVQYL